MNLLFETLSLVSRRRSSARWSRHALLALARSEATRRAVELLPFVEHAAKRRAARYVAGESLPEGVAAVERVQSSGLAVCLERLGELVRSRAAVADAVSEQIEIARRVRAIDADVTLGLDLTQLGLEISHDFCLEQVARIAAAHAPRRLDLDAREYARIDATNDIVLELARSGIAVQMTLQANLRRSPTDWPPLIAAGVGVRLVKGAFPGSLEQAYRYGEQTDAAFRRLALELDAAGARLALATHDRALREELLALLGPTDCEFLMGVADADARQLAAQGIKVRIHVPFGRGWFRYWLRRVAEARGG
jgi:proline dehydrogenase